MIKPNVPIIFCSSSCGSMCVCSVFEDQMKSIQFSSLHPKVKVKDVHCHDPHHDHHHHHCHFHNSACCSVELPSLPPSPSDGRRRGGDKECCTSLPPLVKVQGPFKEPEKVWRQRIKPLEPTLRVATRYNAVEIARSAILL